jgi:hypothetical protein
MVTNLNAKSVQKCSKMFNKATAFALKGSLSLRHVAELETFMNDAYSPTSPSTKGK